MRYISNILKTLPSSPGVYRMIDERDGVLYVGKARNLKKRVQSYTRLPPHSNRIQRMITATTSMEFVTTETEAEALLLEANLIKRLKPRYNVLLRDDKSFPHILIARDHKAPQILKSRGARKRKGDYFGPFASAGAVNRTVNILQRAFLLRNCSDSVFESRTRPCLLYQIKRCSAPCTGEIKEEDYNRLVEEACRFLRGESGDIRDKFVKLMDQASEALEFEKAADYRDRIAALTQIRQHQGINLVSLKDADIFALHREAGQISVQLFFFRTGQNWGNRAFFPRADKTLESGEILEAFIAQFYDNKDCPNLVLLSHSIPHLTLLSEALTTKAGRKVTVAVPKRGEKKDVVKHALTNAREALGRRLAEASSQAKLVEKLSQTLGLDEAPSRIEVYDNSHIQGAHAVGAMIVSGRQGFLKSHYRKFNIKSETLTPGDDYGMMREMLTRRFRRLLEEHGEKIETREKEKTDNEDPLSSEGLSMEEADEKVSHWPDLLIIDGGAGQLSAVQEVLDDLGLSFLPLLSIAKGPNRNAGRETFHMSDRKSFILEAHDPVLYFIQRLRDEAHRFAIGSHRARRQKAQSANLLDEVPGIGPARKRALLKHFGSAKAVGRAGVADLRVVDGISSHMAQAIYDFFHEQNH